MTESHINLHMVIAQVPVEVQSLYNPVDFRLCHFLQLHTSITLVLIPLVLLVVLPSGTVFNIINMFEES